MHRSCRFSLSPLAALPLSPLAALTLSLFATSPAGAQVVTTPAAPQVGTSQPASAEPPVKRPATTPCSVALLTNQAFADYSNKPLAYTPPTGCAGPWAKVVFSADFTVTAGRQFDRTAKFFLGGANIYFGTTAEPRATLSPSWHVERDLTELSSLLKTAQTGQAILGNFVGTDSGVTYNGIIYANARLDFYPADAANPAPLVPNTVLAFPTNDTARVSTTADKSTGTFTFPRNLERVYLDVISQSQSADEFWYTCVPSNVAGELQNCGNSAFRETEVAIDGTPAGLAPVYPWIYTGGIDPYLWEPIVGVETLNLKPYRVDLTPFAGRLADGKQHSVSVSVFNANGGFDIASTLLLYTDAGGSTTSGDVSTNTLTAAPNPQVDESLNTAADGTISGAVNVRSEREYTLSGFVNTSHGRVETTVQVNTSFANLQDEKVSGTEFKQNLQQTTDLQEVTTTTDNTGTVRRQHDVSYPLVVDYRQAPNSDGSIAIATYVKQGKTEALRAPDGANSPNPVVSSAMVETSDTLHYNAAGSFTGHDNNRATASYGAKDAQHSCFYRGLAAEALILTSANDSTSCSLAP